MGLRTATPEAWVQAVLDDFSAFLVDHADCERKAASLAMALAVRFAERDRIVEPLLGLAQEELRHFTEVYQLMRERGLRLKSNQKDPYVSHFVRAIRNGEDAHFLDKMLVSGIIEARGHERFTLLANTLDAGPLQQYYQRFANEEAGHYRIFDRLARMYFEDEVVDSRLSELFDIEAEIVGKLPHAARVH